MSEIYVWKFYSKRKKDKEILVTLEIFISLYKVMMCWVVGKTQLPSLHRLPSHKPLPPLQPVGTGGAPSRPATGAEGDPDPQKPWLLFKPAGRCSLSPATPAGTMPPLHPELPPTPPPPPPLGSVFLSIRLSICLSQASAVCSKHTHIFFKASKRKKINKNYSS